MNKQESNILKGIGIILMYIHHLYYLYENFEGMDIVFDLLSKEQTVRVALACKVCVAVFVFVTAYGMTKSITVKKLNTAREVSGYAVQRYIKLMMGFWFVFIIAQCTSFIGDRYMIYGEDKFSRIRYMIIDFLGIANLFGSPTLNATWWYMSFAILLIFILPLVVFAVKKTGLLIIPLSIVIPVSAGANMGIPFFWYLLTISLGVVFAEYSWFEKIKECLEQKESRTKRCIVSIVILIGCVLLFYERIKVTHVLRIAIYDAIIVVCLAFLSVFIFGKIPFVREMLSLLGKHSMNMFMIHTFIKAYYFHDFSYGWRHSILILIVLLLDTLLLSVIFEWIKKKIAFDKLIHLLCQKSEKVITRLI